MHATRWGDCACCVHRVVLWMCTCRPVAVGDVVCAGNSSIGAINMGTDRDMRKKTRGGDVAHGAPAHRARGLGFKA